MACRAAAGCRKLRDAAIDPLRQPARGAARPRPAGAPSLDGLLDDGAPSRAARPVARRTAIGSAAIAAQRLGGRTAAAALRGARGPAEPGLVARLRARLPKVRPFKALTIATFSLALVGIVANAMVLQRGRHPAPLFGLGQSAEDPAEGAPSRSAALPPPPAAAPVERTGSLAPPAAPALDPAPPAAPVPAAHAPARPHRAEPAAAPAKPLAHALAKPHPRPGHASGTTVGAAKPAAHADGKAKPAATASAPDRRAATEAAAILAHPGHAAPAKGTASAPARPHAPRHPAEAKAEPQATTAATE